MVAQRTSSSRIINRFLKEAEKSISIEKTILFGSYATHKKRKWSDIDLAIISDDFKGIAPFERLVILGNLAWKSKTTNIEALGYTVKEYKQTSPWEFLSEIKRKGIVVYERK